MGYISVPLDRPIRLVREDKFALATELRQGIFLKPYAY